MRILREEYTQAELKERISTTKNIIQALIDSLYILSDSFYESSISDELKDKFSRYANGYIRDIKDISTNFDDDFEDFLNDNIEEVEEEELIDEI